MPSYTRKSARERFTRSVLVQHLQRLQRPRRRFQGVAEHQALAAARGQRNLELGGHAEARHPLFRGEKSPELQGVGPQSGDALGESISRMLRWNSGRFFFAGR